jgi:sialate O-acetylesterase
MKRSRCVVWVSLVLFVLTLPAAAETKLPKIFSDHMVLQRGQELSVWGTDDAAKEVTLTLGDAKATA